MTLPESFPKFAEPTWLAGGAIACIVLVLLYWRLARMRDAQLRSFAAAHLLPGLTSNNSVLRRRLKQILLLGGVAFSFVALARPQWGGQWQEVKRRGIDVMIAIDTSKSMLAEDIKPSRLQRAKMAVADLVQQVKGDRVGLIAFAGSSFLQCPLTLDEDAFMLTLDEIDTNIIPKGGTNIASAINEARSAYQNSPNAKVLVLITDGEDLDGGALEAAKAAAKDGLKIYTVGVGTASGEILPLPKEGGGTEFVKDANGEVVRSKLDESMLKQIADATGGAYAALGQKGEGLMNIYNNNLKTLPEEEVAARQQFIYNEQFQWPLGLAIACLMIETLIATRKWEPKRAAIPAAVRGSLAVNRARGQRTPGQPRDIAPVKTMAEAAAEARRGATAAVKALAILGVAGAFLGATPAAHAVSPKTATETYTKGQYDQALEQFKEVKTDEVNQPALDFNTGAAAYKAGKMDEALASFQKSLGTPDLKLQQQGYYNLGNTLFRAGEPTEKTEPQKTIEAWKKSVESYESSLKLKPDDADAKFNLEYVKKRLEKLQQQQDKKDDKKDQQNKDDKKDQKKDQDQKDDQKKSGQDKKDDQNKDGQDKDKKDSQDQKDQKDGKSGNDQKDPKDGKGGGKDQDKDQAKGDQPKDNKNDPAKDGKDKQDQQAKNQPGQGKDGQDKKDQQAKSQQPKPGDKDKDQAKNQPAPGEKKDKGEEADEKDEPAQPGQMSKAEARNLLQALKDDEKRMPATPATVGQMGSAQDDPKKDW